MDNKKRSPVYLNLFKIRMPVAAVVSVAHRLSGILLLLFVPLFIFQFGRSIKDADTFQQVLAWLSSPLLIPIYIVFTWSLSHHFFAGLRFLLLDLHIGISRDSSCLSAWVVNVAAILFTMFVGIWLI
jgi:succinate dehydrogenase / fumarate reductase cytochrome b subunit